MLLNYTDQILVGFMVFIWSMAFVIQSLRCLLWLDPVIQKTIKNGFLYMKQMLGGLNSLLALTPWEHYTQNSLSSLKALGGRVSSTANQNQGSTTLTDLNQS